MNIREVICNDYFRNKGSKISSIKVIKLFLSRRNDTMKFIIAFRIAQATNKIKLLNKFTRAFSLHYSNKYNFEIPLKVKIGKGLRLPHWAGGIVIHCNAVIGDNCEIMQGCTIGNNIMKSRNEVAVIGNNVILGAGSKIIGKVKIGDNVVVGANTVVTHDIKSNTIVAGIPAKVIKENVKPIIINSLE